MNRSECDIISNILNQASSSNHIQITELIIVAFILIAIIVKKFFRNEIHQQVYDGSN